MYELLQINILSLMYAVVTECSQVIDKEFQKSINVTDYCTDFEGCEEGTHVMCLHYDPNRQIGPACSGAVNITITPDYAQLILGIMNKIRSRVTKGIVKGRDGVNLPRAYGVYRLNWDEELATFAQVWANQCRLASDLCRSSKKFPKVGQALGLSRFTIYGWRPISLPDSPNTTTITPEKVKYAITSVMSAWYSTKDQVTPQHIKEFGDGSKRMLQNQFLHLVYENVTHIGCGISAYREYVFHSDHAPLYHNSVQIVCNFSSRFQTGTRIYTTEPPTQTGFTVRCGCPLGYDEDEDCLCFESGRQLPYSCKNNNRCKPSVVVLPIFNVEDAPKELRDLGNNNATLPINANEAFDRYGLFTNNKVTNNPGMRNTLDSFHKRKVDRYHADVRSRYFGINRGSRKSRHRTVTPYYIPKIGKGRRSKQSIFSIVPIFELSIRKTNPIKHEKIVTKFKKDVAPRRDFSEAKKLVATYLDKKRSSNTFKVDMESDGYISKGLLAFNSVNNTLTNEKIKDRRNNFYSHQNMSINDLNITTIMNRTENKKLPNEGKDSTLTSLLDKLEEDINEKQFNTKEKEVFDTKIRKIYGTVVGKSDFESEYKLIADSNNNSKIDEVDNYYLKPDDRDIYRDEYFESIKPKDLKKKLVNYNGHLRFSKDNDNTGLIKYPTLNVNYNEFENIEMRNLYDVKKRPETNFRKNLSLRNFYLRNVDDEDFIDIDRRRYYDSKLENLRKKIDLMKGNRYKNKVRKDRKLRPVRPTKPVEDQNTQIRPKEALNSFYVADRARFLHGF